MKILFVSQAPLKKELGGAKVVIELAEEMARIGWDCRLTSLMELVPGPIRSGGAVYAEALGDHLRQHAGEYDVVDYDHCYLPFPRSQFSSSTLMVTRSVLLAHHMLEMGAGPEVRTGSRLKAFLAAGREAMHLRPIVKRAQRTIAEADLVNVANHGDEKTLIKSGVPKSKIVVMPYGIGRERRAKFDELEDTIPARPRVAFVGTFDRRKGAGDLPAIVESIVAAVPEAEFVLLGTTKGREEVLANFSAAVRGAVEVIPSYPAESLHDLLRSCTAGVFPSYYEGFGFGVLEMLAAGVPVVAYDVPGPPEMLPAEYLVASGDRAAMSRKIVDLIRDRDRLAAARVWARTRSRDFYWPDIAKRTSEAYLASWRQKAAR